jgi:hypothetical protein
MDGVMLALVPPAEVSELLVLEGGEPLEEQHITLFYLGSTAEAGGESGRSRLHAAVLDFVQHAGYRGLTGSVGGYGVFTPSEGSDGQHVLVALWDLPGGAEFRTHLGEYLDQHDVGRGPSEHGWIPHQTLLYSEEPIRGLPDLHAEAREEVQFVSVVLAWGGEWLHYPLSAG